MIKFIYYTYRNLVYYRKERVIDHRRVMDIATANKGDDVKRTFTDACLATVGLMVVETDVDAVPWYMPLSRIQKSWVRQANEHGYVVGLT